ncbi:oxidoreductase, partial [Burkholderia sp. TJI49]
MQRWQSPAFGRQHLELTRVPVPTPGPRDVLVRVDAVALNYRDLLILRDGMGMAVPFPLVPGSDMRGEVVATGADVD